MGQLCKLADGRWEGVDKVAAQSKVNEFRQESDRVWDGHQTVLGEVQQCQVAEEANLGRDHT